MSPTLQFIRKPQAGYARAGHWGVRDNWKGETPPRSHRFSTTPSVPHCTPEPRSTIAAYGTLLAHTWMSARMIFPAFPLSAISDEPAGFAGGSPRIHDWLRP